jgi:hypothetical protein
MCEIRSDSSGPLRRPRPPEFQPGGGERAPEFSKTPDLTPGNLVHLALGQVPKPSSPAT